jgi:hypothetical protein
MVAQLRHFSSKRRPSRQPISARSALLKFYRSRHPLPGFHSSDIVALFATAINSGLTKADTFIMAAIKFRGARWSAGRRREKLCPANTQQDFSTPLCRLPA